MYSTLKTTVAQGVKHMSVYGLVVEAGTPLCHNLDAGKLYTIPQPDAKLFWLLKRASPSLYAKALGVGYPVFNKYFK